MGIFDANGFRHGQHGGSKFWPLVTVAIILILLLSYCSLKHRSAPYRMRQKLPAPATGVRVPAKDSSRHFPANAGTGSTAAKPAAGRPSSKPSMPTRLAVPMEAAGGGVTVTGKAAPGSLVNDQRAKQANTATARSSQDQEVPQTPCSRPAHHGPGGGISGAGLSAVTSANSASSATASVKASKQVSSANAGTVFSGPQEELLSVVINGQPTNKTYLFLCPSSLSNAPLYARKKDLEEWRMHVPSVAPLIFDGVQFYPLDDVPGVTYRIDNATQTLYMTSPSGAFQSTVVDGFFRSSPKPQKTPWGGFLNYDLLGTHANGETIVDGLFKVGLFNDWGVGTSDFLDQNMTHTGSHLIRLDTAWRHDDPANMTTLTIGDSITRGGETGLDVRIGGVQYGTNFATQPYFVTFPMPGLSGNTSVPSTVDLYVNNVLKSTQQVPSGPFTVPAVPVVTGPGQVTLVVRNALGQQQVITTSFYASSSLLKKGLNDYSFSLGKLRENYGLDSNDYRNFLATGLFRHGFTQHFTGEVHGEFSNLVNDVSLGGTLADPAIGAVNVAVATSHSSLGNGVLGRFGLQRQWTRFSLGADLQFASPRFTEIGYNGLPAPRRQIAVTAGEMLGRNRGSIYASYLDQQSPLFGRSRLLTAGYSVNVFNNGFLNLSAFHTIGGSSNNGFSLSLTMSFGQRTSLSTGVNSQNGNMQGYAQLQRSLPAGTGSGYRIGTQIGSGALTQAEYDYQNNVGTYSVGAYSSYGSTVYQAEASGGLAFIGGGIYPSRKIEGAFALVKVPEMSGVTVYSQNQPVATTDKGGEALVPNLLPYQNNPLAIGANSLPLGAQVNTLNANAVPRYMSGVIETFPVTNTRGATFTVKVRGGEYLPAGAEVHIVGHSQTFPVGLDGEVYLTGLSAHNIVEASWGDQVCRMVIDMPSRTNDPIPDLGTFQCEGIHF